MSPTKLSRLAILAALAACLQLSAGFFPGVGHLLSVFSTLPIIFAGLVGRLAGNITFFTASLIIFYIHPGEALIFLFTTGLLGLIIGYGIKSNWNKFMLVIFSGIELGIGIHILIFGLGIPALGGLTNNMEIIKQTTFIFGFSLFYSFIWSLFIPKINKLFSFFFPHLQ